MKKFLLILSLLASASAYAGLNKWVDADGKVHYSDQPPPAKVKAEKLRFGLEAAAPEPASAASGVAAASAPSAPKTVAEREAEWKKAQQAKQEAAEKAAKEREKAEEKTAYCDAARQNLRALQDGVRMVEIDAKGERSHLTDEQRRQRIEKAQRDIDTNCK